MAAVAQRQSVDHKPQTTTHQTRTTRQARRPRRRSWARFKPALVLGIMGVAVLMLLGWMSVYARLAVTGYSRSELVAACKQEQLKNQRLRLQVDALCSPNNVVAAAQKSGMVYATQYDYVDKATTVASAGKEVGD